VSVIRTALSCCFRGTLLSTLRSPFVLPTQRVELFGNIFAPSNRSRAWAVFVKILREFQGLLGDRAS